MLGGEERTVTAYTMSEIIASVYREMERTDVKEGILFLDEINCISETLTPMMLQFLQCKTFGNQQLPAGWVVVAAGNPPEYNKSVREFDVVTLDRVKKSTLKRILACGRSTRTDAASMVPSCPILRSGASILPHRGHRRRTAVCHRTRLGGFVRADAGVRVAGYSG